MTAWDADVLRKRAEKSLARDLLEGDATISARDLEGALQASQARLELAEKVDRLSEASSVLTSEGGVDLGGRADGVGVDVERPRHPEVLDARRLGDDLGGDDPAVTALSHDSSSVGGDDAPETSSGSGASEPTEEAPRSAGPRSSDPAEHDGEALR